MSNSIAENALEQIENNKDFRDGFTTAVITLRWEDEIVNIGREKIRKLFEQAEEVTQ